MDLLDEIFESFVDEMIATQLVQQRRTRSEGTGFLSTPMSRTVFEAILHQTNEHVSRHLEDRRRRTGRTVFRENVHATAQGVARRLAAVRDNEEIIPRGSRLDHYLNGPEITTTITTTSNVAFGDFMPPPEENLQRMNISEIAQSISLDWINEIFNEGFVGSDLDLEDVKVTLSDEEFDKISEVCKENVADKDCVICLESISKNQCEEDSVVKLKCDHFFHRECIKEWLCKANVHCPVCRSDTRQGVNLLV